VAVASGDVVVSDGDGVVLIPRERLHDVVDIATAITDVEDDICAAVKIKDARETYGYTSCSSPLARRRLSRPIDNLALQGAGTVFEASATPTCCCHTLASRLRAWCSYGTD
jgi:hypothetical protein